ncbi:MAG TPA: glycosyltransferase [Acetobacteraceae bacterium]|nr:glycosyltransferase [Acetobacteraceae bacterium]
MTRTLLIDARCLQHPDFATRGIGRHIESMLAAAPDEIRLAYTVTGLLDPALPPLVESLRRLFTRLTTTAYAASRKPDTVFLNPAPLSFPPGPILRLLRAPHVASMAVVLDFIPLDFPELYLRDERQRRAYRRTLAALRHYDRFLPISRVAASRLEALIPGSEKRAMVTGVAVRPSLLPEPDAAPLPFGGRKPEILVVSGDDQRKNPEAAILAHGSSTALCQAGIVLRFAGIHGAETRDRLAGLHRQAGANPALLQFAPPLAEDDLARAYAEALLVVAPSRAEGFSLPIIEALAQGTPVLAADEPAQTELIRDPRDRFPPDDAEELRRKAESLALDAANWQTSLARQAGVWRDFTPSSVAARFWAEFAALPAPAISRHAKPRIALLSPLPPELSGCADHSAALLSSLAPHAEATAFSGTPSPLLPEGIAFGGQADPTIMRSRRFDAVIAVLGNSPLHRREMEMLLDHGAAAIVHDARLGGLYRSGFGDARALGAAIAERGAPVGFEELDAWERDQSDMPIRFLGEVASSASPLIVHAAETARWVARHHGVAARFLPFPPYRSLPSAMLTAEGRAAARARLGIPSAMKLIVSFGHIQADKAPERLILAAALLYRSMPFRLVLAGAADQNLAESLRALAADHGLPPSSLILGSGTVPEPVYRDYLAAADCALQLRRAPAGSISGALMDAIAAGLPSVAAATLAEAIMPPGYVQAVLDEAPPEEIAACLAEMLWRRRDDAARRAFLARRNMGSYAMQLLNAVL